jgi:hypothetical protein
MMENRTHNYYYATLNLWNVGGMIGGMLRNVLRLCRLCGMCRRNVRNERRLSCSVERTGWSTAPPLAQAGGVCVYIESAPHAGMVNKTPKTGNKG